MTFVKPMGAECSLNCDRAALAKHSFPPRARRCMIHQCGNGMSIAAMNLAWHWWWSRMCKETARSANAASSLFFSFAWRNEDEDGTDHHCNKRIRVRIDVAKAALTDCQIDRVGQRSSNMINVCLPCWQGGQETKRRRAKRESKPSNNVGTVAVACDLRDYALFRCFANWPAAQSPAAASNGCAAIVHANSY